MSRVGQLRSALAFLWLFLAAGCSEADEPAVGQFPESMGVLTGVVFDPAIRPLANASVRLPAYDLDAFTAEDGGFRFEGLAVGSVAVVVSKEGFAEAAMTATVGGETVRIQLEPLAGGLPYAVVHSFDGFIECGTAHFAACGAPDRGSEIACQNTGQCLGDLTNDDFDVEYTLEGPPQFIQSEVSWSNTQPLGDAMYMIHFARNEEERSQGVDGRFLNETVGKSPFIGGVNATLILENGIGVDSNLVIGVYGGPPGGSFPVPYVGLVLQQRFTVITHAFYYYEPPEGWRFSVDGPASPPDR